MGKMTCFPIFFFLSFPNPAPRRERLTTPPPRRQLCFLYLLAFLDRTNIGNAKIAGLAEDLGLSVSQYNATLTIFFVSYAVFEPLTNILLKRLRPSIFIPIIM